MIILVSYLWHQYSLWRCFMCRTLALLVMVGCGGLLQAAEPAADVRSSVDRGLEQRLSDIR